MITWSLEAIAKVDRIDRIVVATDCSQIADVVMAMSLSNVEVYRRSTDNAQDHSSTESVMLEFIDADDKIHGNDTFLLVQATSVFTTADDINRGLDAMDDDSTDSVLSCIESQQFFWSHEGKALNYDYKQRPRRQDFRGQLVENGAFYINKVRSIMETKNRLSGKIKPVVMPSYTSIELDEPEDWIVAESIMEKLLKAGSK